MSQIYFWNKTLHVSDSSSVHHQEFSTVHTAMVYVIQVCWQLVRRIRTAVSKPVWHIPLPCVQWKTPDDGQRNCPKHVEFYSKNKFETLVQLVGFIMRIYHGARYLNVTFASLFTRYFICNFIPGVWYQLLTNQTHNNRQAFIPVWHSWRLHRHDQR